ncbi:MAG: hypothetical protein V4590_10780 [Bacteroidota bacterium]
MIFHISATDFFALQSLYNYPDVNKCFGGFILQRRFVHKGRKLMEEERARSIVVRLPLSRMALVKHTFKDLAGHIHWFLVRGVLFTSY